MSPDAAVYLERGRDYQERPRPEDQAHAETLFRKALEITPDLPHAHAGLARISVYLYTLGLDETQERIERALEEANRAVEMAPDDGPIRATLALALAAADRLTPALEAAALAVELNPDAAATHASLGIVRRLRNELDAAVASCRHAAALEPNSSFVLIALADALRESELYDAALELYGQAVDFDPEALVPQLGAAAALHQAGRTHSAARAYALLDRDWDYGRTRVRQGSAAVLLKLREYEAALAAYSRIDLPETGSLPTLLTLYGKGYCLLRLGRPAEAEYFLSALIERAPHGYDGPARGREFLFRAYGDLARYFKDRGRPDKVETLLRQACERPLAPARLAMQLATLLHNTDRPDEAAEILASVILAGDPREDHLELSDGILQLMRLRSNGGQRRVSRRGQAFRALGAASERIASSNLGAAHYRLARAQALARGDEEALLSLARARDNGYLPRGLMAKEEDFARIRDEPAFRALLKP